MPVTEIVWKILRHSEAVSFVAQGVFEGSQDDLRDGYIHLSTTEQTAGTLAKHFTAESNLFLLECNLDHIKNDLFWERSRDNSLFPHLYRALMLDDILAVRPIAATAWSALETKVR